MSNIPPPVAPPENPYPRSPQLQGSLEHFDLMMEAYKGLSNWFALGILSVICGTFGGLAVFGGEQIYIGFAIGVFGACACMAVAGIAVSRAYGHNLWLGAILGFVIPVIPFGILVAAIGQFVIADNLKKQYGVKYGLMGFNKASSRSLRAQLGARQK